MKAWESVLALEAGNERAKEEIRALKARIEKAEADLARGRELLDGGDPDSAVAPLEAARAVLGAGDADKLIATARERSAAIQKAVRDIDAALAASDVPLDDAAKAAAELAAKYKGSARARDVAAHAAAAAAERARTIAVTQVRKLVRDRRFGEARDLAASLHAQGVRSAELDAAAQQAEQAIAKLDSLRTRAASSRKSGKLADAREALKELLVALPDDAKTRTELTEIDETIREVTARRDGAEAARRRGAIAQAIELYREAIHLQGADPETEAEVEKLAGLANERTKLLAVCRSAVTSGDGRTCADNAKQLLERFPDDDDARDLQTTGECMDKMVTALLSLAERQHATGDHGSAKETAKCLLRVVPGHARAKALAGK